jgi:hypothetical protein
VWHDGQCSGGATIPPYPSGDVLGSQNGRYWFYVVPGSAPRLIVTSPLPGFQRFVDQVTPITITGVIPAGWSNVTLDYTIAMPGYILKHAQVTASGSTFQIVFDPAALALDYPNLDLIGRDDWQAGLADTFTIGIAARQSSGQLSSVPGSHCREIKSTSAQQFTRKSIAHVRKERRGYHVTPLVGRCFWACWA